MKAFLGKKEVKAKYLKRVRAHQKADEIIKGFYWEDGQGCAIGCTIHSGNHKSYETKLGIPEWLARVEDVIFEGLPTSKSKKWPSEFLNSIKVGADLSKVKIPFVIYVLESLFQNFDAKKYPQVTIAIETCIDLYKQSSLANSSVWDAAYNAARIAVHSIPFSKEEGVVYSVAYSAMKSAVYNAAASAAYSATGDGVYSMVSGAVSSAAYSAAYGAAYNAVGSAAYSAAYGAGNHTSWNAVGDTASDSVYRRTRRAAHVKFSNKLLELLRKCK